MVKGDEKKQAILDVAERLFYLKGFEETSVQDVLDVLKCSKGSFYHHFESKFSVLETLCQQRAEKAFSIARKRLEGVEDILERLNELIYHAFPLRGGEEQFMTLLLPMAASPSGVTLCAQYEQAISARFQPALGAMLERGEAEEAFHLTCREQMPGIIMGLMNQSWRETAKRMIQCQREGRSPEAQDLIPTLSAYRFCVERLIDAPYGTVEIIRITELMQVSQRVMSQVRLVI